jgi:class 3 adenylate cyclase
MKGASSVKRRCDDRVDARKVVTILFADLAGSTALHERLEPEDLDAALARLAKCAPAAAAEKTA